MIKEDKLVQIWNGASMGSLPPNAHHTQVCNQIVHGDEKGYKKLEVVSKILLDFQNISS